MIRACGEKRPRIHPTAFISEAAYIIGDVEIGPQCTVWPGAVLRGDSNSIRLTSNVHIEDGSVLHAVQTPMVLGDTVVIGHAVVLHCARVGDQCMVANNATVLEGAEIGSRCVVDSNSLVKPRAVVPDGSFVSGNPAEVRGETRPDQVRRIELGAQLHRETAARYREAGLADPREVLLEAPPIERALVVVAHPDDAEFYCGGTLALLARRTVAMRIVVCTAGQRGGLGGAALAVRRRAEQEAAAALLGQAEVAVLDYPDGELVDCEELRRDIAAEVRRFRPNAVFTFDPEHAYVQTHSFAYLEHTDHRAAGAATLAVVYPRAALPSFYPEQLEQGLTPHRVAELFLFESPRPDCFVDISEALGAKLAALAAHESQQPVWGGQVDVARRIAADLGIACGREYAEAFTRLRLSF
jgi:carbonic anhydrase/acetyltransferase-like protein (isoleucine patch superfamily)/LmbE family N-acetylglucosaminyl deacetylase